MVNREEHTETVNTESQSTDTSTPSVTEVTDTSTTNTDEASETDTSGFNQYMWDQYAVARSYVPSVETIRNIGVQDIKDLNPMKPENYQYLKETGISVLEYTKNTAITSYNYTFGNCFMPFNELSLVVSQSLYGAQPMVSEMVPLGESESNGTEGQVSTEGLTETQSPVRHEEQLSPEIIKHVN